EGLCPVERCFLDGTIGAIGRVGSAKAAERLAGTSAYSRAGCVAEEIALEVGSAVVQPDHALGEGLKLCTHQAGAGMHHGDVAIGPGSIGLEDEVGSHADNVASAALTPERIGQQANVGSQLKVGGAKDISRNVGVMDEGGVGHQRYYSHSR